MADFCKQCSIDIFGEDSKDLAGQGPLQKDMGWQSLCEGCGPTLVDEEGVCISPFCIKKHGAEG